MGERCLEREGGGCAQHCLLAKIFWHLSGLQWSGSRVGTCAGVNPESERGGGGGWGEAQGAGVIRRR